MNGWETCVPDLTAARVAEIEKVSPRIGDRVRLIGGHPRAMTVVQIDPYNDNGPMATCAWEEGEYTYHLEVPASHLEPHGDKGP